MNKPILIEMEQQEEVCVLRLSGSLISGARTEYVQERVSDIKNAGLSKVLADLRELAAIGSVGIGFLADIYSSVTKNPDGRFVVVSPQKKVQEVLELTRLNRVIPIAPDMASGFALLRSANAVENKAS
jgi:anti-anti-sigma factor